MQHSIKWTVWMLSIVTRAEFCQDLRPIPAGTSWSKMIQRWYRGLLPTTWQELCLSNTYGDETTAPAASAPARYFDRMTWCLSWKTAVWAKEPTIWMSSSTLSSLAVSIWMYFDVFGVLWWIFQLCINNFEDFEGQTPCTKFLALTAQSKESSPEGPELQSWKTLWQAVRG